MDVFRNVCQVLWDMLHGFQPLTIRSAHTESLMNRFILRCVLLFQKIFLIKQKEILIIKPFYKSYLSFVYGFFLFYCKSLTILIIDVNKSANSNYNRIRLFMSSFVANLMIALHTGWFSIYWTVWDKLQEVIQGLKIEP